jgi:hypothetical protein
MEPAAKDARSFRARLLSLLGTPAGARLLLAWLALHDAGISPAELGLDCTLRRALTGCDVRAAVQLFLALLACRDTATAGLAAPGEPLFAPAACREFLLVHESGGVEWFNKERFEELMLWRGVVGLLAGAERPTPRTLATRLGRAERSLLHAMDAAAHAGYRTGLYLRLVEPVTPGAPVKKGARVAEPGGKVKDVKGSAGTGPAGTPHNKVPR